jgi:hypothetical protein
MANVKLAEALLRRKELAMKVEQLRAINQSQLFEPRVARKKVSDDIDDILASVPKLTAKQVTAEYDYYARALRVIDGAIQQANWTCELDVDAATFTPYGD